MPNWTKEQQQAIYETGKNIIVSAGAGSGKTAVLSERVLQKIKNGTHVDELLILTFTNAAAKEMKDRIRECIKSVPSLKKELDKIENSFITTFDSFSGTIVKKYHDLLNISKSISVLDQSIESTLIDEYLEIILEKKYEEKDENFLKLINDFCIKDDYKVKKGIKKLNEKLDMIYNKKEYLDNYISVFYSDEKIDENIERYINFVNDKIKDLDLQLTNLSHHIDDKLFYKIKESISPILNAQNYEELANIKQIKSVTISGEYDEEAKPLKEKLFDSAKEILELTKIESREKIKEEIINTKSYIIAIIDIINKLDNLLINYKNENNLYTFTDIAKMAIKVVLENESVRNELKNSFKEILVDEYQDTSDLQELFISSIENDDLYMVGDIKQSIYRFRNANPDIFRKKYNNYSQNINGMKIDLLKNFRSREEVLSNINLIFDYIMTDDIGGCNYTVSHRMIYGNTDYTEYGTTNQNNDMDILMYQYDKETPYKKEEIEIFAIAQDIKNKVENHYQVFDKKAKIKRDITYSDFSILIDRTTSFDLYKKIFLYHQIPLNIYKDESLTKSDILYIIKNIYKLIRIINDKNELTSIKYSILSIGRSFLFNISDEILFNLITQNKIYDNPISEKILEIRENIESKTLTQILDEIIEKFDIIQKLNQIGNIDENLVKIDYMYQVCDNLSNLNYTYEEFDNFIENLLKNKIDMKYSVKEESSDSVKIMTIHKSKGLEYHICYFSGLSKPFNTSDLKERFIQDKDMGIITPIYKEGVKNTIYKTLFKDMYISSEISEKIRLFYVAMTRAKEKMILVLPHQDYNEQYNEDGVVSTENRKKYNTIADIIYSVQSKLAKYIKEIDIESLKITDAYENIKQNNLFATIIKENEKIETLDYKKYKKEKIETSHFSKENIKLITSEEQKLLNFGTNIHYILETLDFINPNYDNLDSYYKEKIQKFLTSDLLKNIKEAKIYKEYEFIEEDNNEVKTGIIDLMLEYSDHIDIIDYKLKNIDDINYDKQLNGYRNYIKNKTNKNVSCYLYSIIDEKYREVK